MAGAWIDKVPEWLKDRAWYDRLLAYETPIVSDGDYYTLKGTKRIPGVTSVMKNRLKTMRARPLGRRRTVKATRPDGINGAQLGSRVHSQVRAREFPEIPPKVIVFSRAPR